MIFRHVFFILILLGRNLTVWAQDTALQRLYALPDDTLKAKTLALYVQDMRNRNPKKAEEVTEKLLALSRRLRYNQGIGDGLSYLAYFYNYRGEHRRTISNLEEAINHYRISNDIHNLSKCYGNIAISYEALNMNDSAMANRMTAIKLLEKNPTKLLATHYFNLAVQFSNRLDNADKALFYFKKTEEVASQMKDSAKLALAWSGISHTLNDKKEWKQSLHYAEKAVAIAKLIGHNMALSHSYESYSNILLELNRPDAAIEAARLGVDHGETAGYTDGVLTNLNRWSKALGKKSDYKAQAALLEKTLQKVKEFNNIQYYPDIYEGLAIANYHLGNFKKAYEYRVQSGIYSDSNRTERDSRILAELETKYETAQKEKTLSLQKLSITEKEVQLQKSRQMSFYSIAAALGALLIASLLYIHYRNKRRLHQKQLQTVQQEKEIQLLQAVMQGEEKERSRIAKDLHDGVAGMLAAVKMHFNSIALQVGGVLQTEGYQQGILLLDDASVEVRKTSHNLMPEVLFQHGLDEAIRRYSSNVTNSSKLLVQYDSIGEMGRFVDSFELSVYRIVQELLNNIVKHSKASEAIVQLSFQDKLLSITIEDNGIGFTKGGQQKDGMGLRSLQSRVKAMNGKIEFDSTAGQGLNAYLEFETAGLEKGAKLEVA
jgi:signal transduction histidine kinase